MKQMEDGAVGRLGAHWARSQMYSDGVLMDNWYERRWPETLPRFDHCTTYAQDYVRHPLPPHSADLSWERRVKGEGMGRLLLDSCGDSYDRNYSTLYDLQYRHVPSMSTGPLRRRYNPHSYSMEPQQDYTASYGNLTQYGLQECKKAQWDWDKRETLTTQYQESYRPPKLEDLVQNRHVNRHDFSQGNQGNVEQPQEPIVVPPDPHLMAMQEFNRNYNSYWRQ